MFTAKEVVSFLQKDWGVENVEDRFRDDSLRKSLLEEIVRLVHVKVPFQNITLMAVEPKHRKRPSVSTIKEECMSGVGGLCYYINVFVWGLLKGLGFSVHLCIADVSDSRKYTPDTHLLVLISGLDKKGDLHAADGGSFFPTFRVISLDFDEESPVFVDSFLEYKYIRHEGRILRMHGDGDTFKRNDPPIKDVDFFVGKWRRFYSFSLNHSDTLSDFDEVFDKIFTDPSLTPFHKCLAALAFPAQRAVLLVNRHLQLENTDGQMETSALDGEDAFVDCCRRYFPKLQEGTVRKGLHHWHNLGSQSM